MKHLIKDYVDAMLKQAKAEKSHNVWAVVAGSLASLLRFALEGEKEVVIKRMKEVIDEK